MPNIIINPNSHPEDKANKAVDQDLKFGSDTSLFKKDKLDYADLPIRYIRIVFGNNFAYTYLTPGVEKPKDQDGVSYQYCSKYEALRHIYIMNYGIDAFIKFKKAYRERKRMIKNMELELIRGSNAERILKK